MNFSPYRAPAAAEQGPAPELQAVSYDQLQRTVLRLVQAALADAWHGRGQPSAIDRPQPALPPAPRRDAALSPREREVLARIVAGDSNKMVARALGLSPHTVKRHVANILDKLGARSRAQAAAWMLARH